MAANRPLLFATANPSGNTLPESVAAGSSICQLPCAQTSVAGSAADPSGNTLPGLAVGVAVGNFVPSQWGAGRGCPQFHRGLCPAPHGYGPGSPSNVI